MTTNNTHDYADHFPRRANQHVANMQFACDVDNNGHVRMELGAPPALDVNGIVAAYTVTGGVTVPAASILAHRTLTGKYGRNVTVDASAAGTPVVTITGLDYLGQPMTENITAAGTTAVAGKKAFKEVTGVAVATGITGTVDIGYGDILGLPYAVGAIVEEYQDGVAATTGTSVVAVTATPTATTGDPRGTYLPDAATDGTKDLVLIGKVIEGDLHGLAHYAA